jgi:hypothetical protein
VACAEGRRVERGAREGKGWEWLRICRRDQLCLWDPCVVPDYHFTPVLLRLVTVLLNNYS